MELDLDTFLVTVYCVCDDLYRQQFAAAKPARPGPQPELSDSEVLTLAVLAQWQPRNSESAFVQYAATHWRAYFPRLLSQEAFNRRVRDLGGCWQRWARRWPGCCAPGSKTRLATKCGTDCPFR